MIIVHYGEIGLKGTNRPYFENTLAWNIKQRTGHKVKREYGRLIIESNDTRGLKNIPGIAYYTKAVSAELDIKDIIKKAKKLVTKGPFRVTARRSNKNFKHTSPEINRLVGEKIDLPVDLKKPKTELFIEIGEKKAYLYTKKHQGIGGLPVGVTGKLIALVSGGIDSPVACHQMIKRGCEVIIVHFYNEREGVREKIEALAKTLAKYQGKIKAVMIPFLEIQREVIMKVPAKTRMIIYRRLMFKIASRILKDEGAKGYVTGDNMAQVASQTLENLKVIWEAADENVYAPLIGLDKQEIIELAKKIGSYETSILPHNDCCSYLIAKHPETRSDLKTIKKQEANLSIKRLINKSLKEKEELITLI